MAGARSGRYIAESTGRSVRLTGYSMSESRCLEITVSKMVSVREVEQLIARVLPDYQLLVTKRGETVPDEFPAVWVVLRRIDYPDWPCMLSFDAFPVDSPLGKYPDLRLAEY